MKVLAEETWSWMLFEHEGALLFSVLCGSVAIYGIEIALGESERDQFNQQGESFLKQLARQVRQEPSRFQARQIHSFNELPGLLEATSAWRAKRAAAP